MKTKKESSPQKDSYPLEMHEPPVNDAGSNPDGDYEYKILTEGYEFSNEWVSGEKLHMDYLRTTDGLINKITKGIEVVNEETGEKERQPYTTIIFLDKSGRPVSHFVREMWPTFAKDLETGEVPPLPDFRFLNIDRRQWINKIDPNFTGVVRVDHLDKSVFRSLRSIFLSADNKRKVAEQGLTESIDDMPASLDNQTILVVDETHYSGDTLKITTELLQKAFPTAHIGNAYWMKEKSNGENRNPRWYDDSTVMGRGVNDRYASVKKLINMDPSEKTLYQKLGSFFLSAPHWKVAEGLKDDRFYDLVRDIKELASNPNVPILPSPGRDDAEDRIVAYNTGLPPSSFTQEEKDAKIDEIIAQKRAVEAESSRLSPVWYRSKK